ncbi:MAG TPA: AEC family transporter [Stellaceae bacterium]|nr:AEC family transporter [Stellaceae bacterium]
MGNIVLLFLCLMLGMALRASGRVPDNAHQTINAFVINVSLPALALLQIPLLQFNRQLLVPVSMPWLMFTAVAASIWLIGSRLRLTPATTGALVLTAGLGNTSFVGVPMIESFYGRPYMAVGLLIDQLGTYLVLSTLGITIACLCSRGTASIKEVAWRVASFPPLIALAVALAVAAARLPYPPLVGDILQRLAVTLAPLALVSVGLQLRFGALRGKLCQLGLGLGIKLVAAPLLLAIVYLGWVGASGPMTRVTLFEAAMGPQIGGAIIATQYGLDPPLVTLMVGIGTLAAFLSLPAWWYALSFA